MIQKKKFSEAIAANISVVEGLIGISKKENNGISTVTIKDFKTQYSRVSLQIEEEMTLELEKYPGLILAFEGNSAWGCDSILKAGDGLSLIKSTTNSQIVIDNSLATSGKVNLYLPSSNTLKVKNNMTRVAGLFLRFIPIS